MNILVLGATGTIGTPLTQRLHDDGHTVTAWSRRTPGDLSTQLIPLDMVEGTELIIDVTDAETPVKVGSEVRFLPNYGGLLSASTSPHVRKVATRRP